MRAFFAAWLFMLVLAASFVDRDVDAQQTAAQANADLDPLLELIGQTDDGPLQLDLLRGMQQALEGRRRVNMPGAWPAAYEKIARSRNVDVRQAAQTLGLLFDDPQAKAALRQIALDANVELPVREKAVESLARTKDEQLISWLQELVAKSPLRRAALRGLAAFNDPATPRVILRNYAAYSPADKNDALSTLASRPAYALELLSAIERNEVNRNDVAAHTVQQLLGLKDQRVAKMLQETWGVTRQTPADKAALIAKYKGLLTVDFLKHAAPTRGRGIFTQTCASCHVLFDAGGRLGPELTGSQRANLDYVLMNILDPSAAVGRDYQVTIVQTADGRVISGIVKQEDESAVTMQTATETLLIPKTEIENRQRTTVSMMPEGLLAKLSDADVRDLVAYLASPQQVPLPAGFEPAK